jgi:signal transduction histidine kinase
MFAVASVVEALAAQRVHDRWLVVLLALGWTLPFAVRARYPLWAPVVACVFLAAFALTAPERSITSLTMPFVAALAAAVSLGLVGDRRLSIAGWAAVIATAAVIDSQSGSAYSDFFWSTLILTLAWFFGSVLGSRLEQTRELSERVEAAERERATAADRATAEERARIARELHDVVAHSVSVMVVQASGVRRLLKDEQHREREALISVEQIGRQALTEMRRMLGVMRSEADPPAALAPQPGLQHLDRLIAQVEEAGMAVTLRVEGERPELSPGIDLSAYRIVQEGLTNALKHAKGAHAEVVVRYIDTSVELEIADDGPGLPAGDGMGHGLVGMRERVALYGGTLDAGPRDGGGFLLRAQLPVEGRV